jgi:hypothetical protein
MENKPDRTRTLAFLISGLMDCLGGGVLLLVWLGILPLDLGEFGLSRGWAGVIGAVMAVSGVAVVTYLATRLREPGE